jgi:hypothetical protein
MESLTEDWSDNENTYYPLGTRFSIRTSIKEPNDFVKSMVDFSSYDDKTIFNQNILLTIKKKCKEFLREQFTSSIIPIRIKIYNADESNCADEADNVDMLTFDTIPFINAKKYPGISELRIEANKIYFWYEKLLAENKYFYAMYSFKPVSPQQPSVTNLFFRGIRFNISTKPDESYLASMFNSLGFSCDINIMSGKANELLEINRDFVKKEMFAELRRNIADGVEDFFKKISKLIISLYESTACDDKTENGKNLQDLLVKLLESSPNFIKKLCLYIFVKSIPIKVPVQRFLTGLSGGLIDVALIDKKNDVISFLTEPMLFADTDNYWLIDSVDFTEGSKIELVGTKARPHENDFQNKRIIKALRNDLPELLDLQFEKARAFARAGIVNSKYILIYKLKEKDNKLTRNNNRLADYNRFTEIDSESYRIIINDIVAEYINQLEETRVDKHYFPLFPAPSPNCLQNGLDFEKIKKITFYRPPSDEFTYCDPRYARFILSPLPIGLINEYINNKNESIWKQNIAELMASERYKSYKPYYDQTIEYIKNNYNDNNKTGIWDDAIIENEIKSIWDAYTKFILSLL